ncbi:hypothetical protein HGI79_09070 [Clostridium sp. DJ247]|nr:hypothetical protein [Clostridium sp. DJ247]
MQYSPLLIQKDIIPDTLIYLNKVEEDTYDIIRETNKLIEKKVYDLMSSEGELIKSINKAGDAIEDTNNKLISISSAVQKFDNNIVEKKA